MANFKPLSEETIKKLKEAGRENMIEIHNANIEGYVGIMPNGNLVDRRKVPEAMPIVGNPMLNIAPAKQLENDPHADWFKTTPTTI